MALGLSSCVAILRCCRLSIERHLPGPLTSLLRNIPLVTIRGRGDAAATKYRLALHEILLAAREDRAVGNEQVLGNARIRNYNKQLVAHPDREKWPISPRPSL